MNEPNQKPKKKYTEQELDSLFEQSITLPSFKKPANLSDWETAYQNVYGEGAPGTAADSIKLGLKMTPAQEMQERRRGVEDVRKRQKFELDYKSKLFDLKQKQKESGVGTEDVGKKRSEFFKKMNEAQTILNKSVKKKQVDEEGIETTVEKPAYSARVRKQAAKTVNQYSDSLRTLVTVEKLRQRGIKANMADVETFFKQEEKTIDGITSQMISKGIPDRVAMVFKNTAVQIMRDGNSKETAMQRAAQQIKALFPQYFGK